jgi:hypothetical protein
MTTSDQPNPPPPSGELLEQPPLLRLLDLVPVAWLLLAGYAYAMLAFNPTLRDRGVLPGVELAEGVALPLLCLFGIAAIIRYFYLRKGRSRLSPPSGEGEHTL